jgi:hypothetical protein
MQNYISTVEGELGGLYRDISLLDEQINAPLEAARKNLLQQQELAQRLMFQQATPAATTPGVPTWVTGGVGTAAIAAPEMANDLNTLAQISPKILSEVERSRLAMEDLRVTTHEDLAALGIGMTKLPVAGTFQNWWDMLYDAAATNGANRVAQPSIVFTVEQKGWNIYGRLTADELQQIRDNAADAVNDAFGAQADYIRQRLLVGGY